MRDYIDFTGQQIHVDDYIAYSVGAGRSAILKIGRVVARVEESAKQPAYYDKENHRALLAVSCDYWRGHPSYQESDGYILQNNGKPLTLTFAERIIVLASRRVHPTARRLLDRAAEEYHDKQVHRGGNRTTDGATSEELANQGTV